MRRILSHECSVAAPEAGEGLRPPPALLFPVTTCKPKANLLPHSPPPAAPRPAPHRGPSCGRPQRSVIPLTLLSALGPSGQIKPLSHTHPEKLRARWDGTSGVRSSTRPMASRAEGRARAQRRIWLGVRGGWGRGEGEGAQSGGSQRATCKSNDMPWTPTHTPGTRAKGALGQLLDDPSPGRLRLLSSLRSSRRASPEPLGCPLPSCWATTQNCTHSNTQRPSQGLWVLSKCPS